MAEIVDAIRGYGYTGWVKVTVEIPDALYRQVKVRAAAEGRTVRDVTVELYQQWLAAHPARTDEDRRAAGEAWLAEWEQAWREINALPRADPRTTRQILVDDRR